MSITESHIICYELNEVSPRVLNWYVKNKPESNLSKLLSTGTYRTTHASDEGILSPWVTWATVHRGVKNTKHCISDFGQDLSEVNLEYPPVWELLKRAGVSTGVFGSLHSYPPPSNADEYAFYLPDTFASGAEAYPKYLESFQSFNLAMVDRSTRNVRGGVSMSSALQLLMESPKNGLKLSTMCKAALQIATEKIDGKRKVRRRTTQTELAFDLFHRQLREKVPQFSTFFTNHVASAMHRYWPAAFPEDYETKVLPAEWLESYASEIEYAMDVADNQIGRLMNFCKNNSKFSIMVLSSMGQDAVDSEEVVKSQLYIKDLEVFFSSIGIQKSHWEPRRAMLPRYVNQFSAEAAAIMRQLLPTTKVNGQHIEFVEHKNGVFMFKLGQVNLDEASLLVELDGKIIDWKNAGLEITEIQDATGSYAYHVPEGILLSWSPLEKNPQKIAEVMLTEEIAGHILQSFNVAPRQIMKS